MVFAVVIPGRSAQEEYADFLEEAFGKLAAQYSMHRFCFLSGSVANSPTLPNVQWIKKPGTRNLIARWWWYQVQLPHQLKKLDVDHFIGAEGWFSRRGPCTQSLVLPHGFFTLSGSPGLRPGAFHLKKAGAIAVLVQDVKALLVQNHRLPSEKIHIVPTAVPDHFVPLEYGPAEEVRAQYTGGSAYFVCTGVAGRDSITWVLKAFSRFKKRQKSSMKLVVVGYNDAAMKQPLMQYRFRQDVVLLSNLETEEEARLYGAAYALVDGGRGRSRTTLIKALQCGIPVLTIAANHSLLQEAALYFEPEDQLQLAEQMMLVYKDENARARIIENGNILAAGHSWEKCTSALWACITAAMKE